jgi:hypothetical protein
MTRNVSATSLAQSLNATGLRARIEGQYQISMHDEADCFCDYRRELVALHQCEFGQSVSRYSLVPQLQ